MRLKVNKIHSLSVLIFIIVFLFSYRSNPLYQMLCKLLSMKPNELLELGRNARKEVVKKYSIEIITKQYYKIY